MKQEAATLFAAAVLGVTLAACGFSSDELADRWIEATEALDAEAVSDLFAVDAQLVDPAMREPAMGRVAIYASYAALFTLPDVAIEAGAPLVSADGEQITIEWVWSGTHLETGTPYRVAGVSAFTVADGFIVEERSFYDPSRTPLGSG